MEATLTMKYALHMLRCDYVWRRVSWRQGTTLS